MLTFHLNKHAVCAILLFSFLSTKKVEEIKFCVGEKIFSGGIGTWWENSENLGRWGGSPSTRENPEGKYALGRDSVVGQNEIG